MSWKKKTIETRRERIQVPDTVRFEANVSGKEEQTNLSMCSSILMSLERGKDTDRR